MVTLHKSSGGDDEVVVDLSPLRIPKQFEALAVKCAAALPGAVVEPLEGEAQVRRASSMVCPIK